jgi:alpha/beta superfamily hydrolase
MHKFLLFSLAAALLSSCNRPQTVQNTDLTAVDFATARKGFKTKILVKKDYLSVVAEPPKDLMRIVSFPTALGGMDAYLTNIPNDGKLHPAIIWITGGWGNDIGDNSWSEYEPSNDQSGSVFYKNGIVTMYPSQRGGNKNAGSDENCYGEIDDIIAAAEFLRKQKGIDTSRIYLGGHSTGGTKVLLVAECYHKFKATFSFGPATEYLNYGTDNAYFNMKNPIERQMRAPYLWLSSLRTPVYVMEGETGNVESLLFMQKKAIKEGNTYIKFDAVKNKNHFSVLYPKSLEIAQKIVKNEL